MSAHKIKIGDLVYIEEGGTAGGAPHQNCFGIVVPGDVAHCGICCVKVQPDLNDTWYYAKKYLTRIAHVGVK